MMKFDDKTEELMQRVRDAWSESLALPVCSAEYAAYNACWDDLLSHLLGMYGPVNGKFDADERGALAVEWSKYYDDPSRDPANAITSRALIPLLVVRQFLRHEGMTMRPGAAMPSRWNTFTNAYGCLVFAQELVR